MFTRLSLRLRIFLFFALLAVGAAGIAGGALWFGWSRAEPDLPMGPFATALIAFAFMNTGLLVAIWLLFDENVAKPIDRLAASLRLRAHSGVDLTLDPETAKYLGDLAPAARAVATTLESGVLDVAAQVADETERLKSETERLTALLTEIPVATILANRRNEIVLYDGQAAALLGKIGCARLKAPLTDYFVKDALDAAIAALREAEAEVETTLTTVNDADSYDVTLKPLGAGDYMLIFRSEAAALSPAEQRPLVYDFSLLDAAATHEIDATPIRDLCFVAFDTETTGLSPETDDVIQLGAVRVLKGRIVAGEIMDSYVDPNRPIPPASTRVHGISDADVAGAPDFGTICQEFHHFAGGAVLVAHNAPFDLAFLKREEAATGLRWAHPVLDTVLLSAVVFGVTEQHSLDALCERLAIKIASERRHTALGDAEATAEVLVRLIPLLEGKGLVTFADVVAETRRHGRLLQDMNPTAAPTEPGPPAS